MIVHLIFFFLGGDSCDHMQQPIKYFAHQAANESGMRMCSFIVSLINDSLANKMCGHEHFHKHPHVKAG